MKLAPARPAIMPLTLQGTVEAPVVAPPPSAIATPIHPFARANWLRPASLPASSADITASTIYAPIISASGDVPPLHIAALGVKLIDKASYGDWPGAISAGMKGVAAGYKWAATSGVLGTGSWVATTGDILGITAQIAGEYEKYAKDKKSV